MELEHTSERLIEDYYRDSEENYLIYLFHMAAYEFAKPHTEGKVVLDFGCGSGYGAHHLSSHVAKIVGVDVDQAAVDYAVSRYQAPNLSYDCVSPADVEPLPFDDATFDTVISFQVIEHVGDTDSYLSEIFRVLKPGGVFICTTPDRSTRLLPGQKPWNMWHLKEYSQEQFHELLVPHFADTKVFQQGGKPGVIDIEIKRARKVMWLTLPFTLPFVPEALRVSGLRMLKKLNGQGKQKPTTAPKEFGFSLEDLSIDEHVAPSVNLVALARKPA